MRRRTDCGSDRSAAHRPPLERGIIDDATRALFEEQIARLDRGETVEVLRNPWLE